MGCEGRELWEAIWGWQLCGHTEGALEMAGCRAAIGWGEVISGRAPGPCAGALVGDAVGQRLRSVVVKGEISPKHPSGNVRRSVQRPGHSGSNREPGARRVGHVEGIGGPATFQWKAE